MSGRRGGRAGGKGGGGGNTGPAIMLMPPHIRATFMPNPPLTHIAPVTLRRKHPITGIMPHLSQIAQAVQEAKEKTKAERPQQQQQQQPGMKEKSPTMIKKERAKTRQKKHGENIKPLVETYRQEQRDSGGEFDGMNCYNTLFVGRLAYEVTERKLLREMEVFGPVKDIRIIFDKKDNDNKSSKSKGYAFVEYEHEEDMKRAYRAADGMRLEGREIVVDVERGHTVPSWLPRRLGGGLGGTRAEGDAKVTRPGRYDPNKPQQQNHQPLSQAHPPSNMPGGYGGGGGGGGGGGPPHSQPHQYHHGHGGGGPPMYGMGRGSGGGGGPSPGDRRYPPGRGDHPGGPPPPPRYGDRGGGYDSRGPPPPRYDDRKRRRGDSPPRYSSRRRY